MIGALLVLPLAAVLASRLPKDALPPQAAIVINALFPGSGLVLLEARLVEIVVAVLAGDVGLFLWHVSGSATPPLAVGLACAFWAGLYPRPALQGTGTAPAGSGERAATAPAAAGTPAPFLRPPEPPSPGERDPSGHAGYTLALRCTECGAEIEVPVLHHMAHCEFCGSNHLVVGHASVLQLTVPDRIHDEAGLRQAVLDHYRYQRYVELYQRRVAPIQRRATIATADGQLVRSPEAELAAQAAERQVAAQADAYRARLARTLRVEGTEAFLAPYWHGMGTLYQAAFGRSPQDQEKQLAFGLASLEASVPAFEGVELPAMGHLTYLRSLLPAASREGWRTLPPTRPVASLREGFGDLERKKILKEIDIIGMGNLFSPDATAVVWRPWWVVRVVAEERRETLLVDGGTGRIEGPAPVVPEDRLSPLPEEAVSAPNLRFLPMECPVCGHEFVFRPDAIVHFCTNCHRAIGLEKERKVEVPYERGVLQGVPASDLLPFWRFPLRLRTADGAMLTDIAHLTDGIDGTLDQIGDDAPVNQDEILVPAFHVINPRLMTQAYNRLFHFALSAEWEVVEGRYPLDERVHPHPVTLSEGHARRFAPYYLANAFGRRDLARTNIHQVTAWLFRARLEARGRLTYLPVPRPILEPFLGYIGRFQAPALR